MSEMSLDRAVSEALGEKDLLILRQGVLIAHLQAEVRAAKELLSNRTADRREEVSAP